MNGSEWCVRVVLPKCCIEIFHMADDINEQTVHFEREILQSKDGFQSDILVGRMVYINELGKQVYSKPLLLKIFPEAFQRSNFTELTFQNEIFVYNRIIPFYASLNDSISSLFAKFYHAEVNFSVGEEGVIVMENLAAQAYRSASSKTYLDIKHLLLMVKKLGEFHAYSYKAKEVDKEKFFALVSNLIETHFAVTKTMPKLLHVLNEPIFEALSQDACYSEKVQQIRQFIGNAEEFFGKIIATTNEPMAVLCHGDFVRSNALFRYDLVGNPVDVKFIDLGNVRYCTPINDLGQILYMNTDQPTRDEYWDLLIQTYYDSLKNTFPDNDLLPSKEEILSEFKHNIFQPYVLAASYTPWMMAIEESNCPSWFTDLFSPEYDQYKDLPMPAVPDDVRIQVILKMFLPHRVKKSTEILRDIIDRGFI